MSAVGVIIKHYLLSETIVYVLFHFKLINWMMFETDKFREIHFSGESLISEYLVFAIKICKYFDRLCQIKSWQLCIWGLFHINNIFLILPNHLLFECTSRNYVVNINKCVRQFFSTPLRYETILGRNSKLLCFRRVRTLIPDDEFNFHCF